MNQQSLAIGFGASQYTIGLNLEDVTHEESLVQPGEGGNCINWVAGHLLVCRDMMMRRLGEDEFLNEDEAEPYKRGASAIKPGDACLQLSKVVEGLQFTGEMITSKIKALSADALTEELDASVFPVPVEDQSLATWLSLFLFHEGYHGGQIGILRGVIGKPGRIK